MFTITGDKDNGRQTSDGENPIVCGITDHIDSPSPTRPDERNWLAFQDWREYLDRKHQEQILLSSTTNASTARMYRQIVSNDSLDEDVEDDTDDHSRLEVDDVERTHYELFRVMEQKIEWLNDIISSLGQLLQHNTTAVSIEKKEVDDDQEVKQH